VAFAAPADVETSLPTFSIDDVPSPELRAYCKGWNGQDNYNCEHQGVGFCEGKFEGTQKRECIKAHGGSRPSKGYLYCERWDEGAKKDECNQGNPSFCTSQFMEGTTSWGECLAAFLPQSPNKLNYCDIYKDTGIPGDRQKFDDCRNPNTGFCIKNFPIKSRQRQSCCEQDGFTFTKQKECKAALEWSEPDASPPSSPKPCYLGIFYCKTVLV
jgi:hypothetical protein